MRSMEYTKSIEYVTTHPWLKNGFNKLKKSEIEIIYNFLSVSYSDKNEAMMACNRMFMDMPNKPKNWATIMEIVSAIISHNYSL